MSALLNGRIVANEEIDPAKHRYIGTFRPPTHPWGSISCDLCCPCGTILRYRGQEMEHWRKGCYDMPQYVDLPRECQT